MPLNYKEYPKNWKKEIRPAILKRANNRCEECGLQNHSLGYRDKAGFFIPFEYNTNFLWVANSQGIFGMLDEIKMKNPVCPIEGLTIYQYCEILFQDLRCKTPEAMSLYRIAELCFEDNQKLALSFLKKVRNVGNDYKGQVLKIALQIAHLDHDHLNHTVDYSRLKALCQKCHFEYDLQLHKEKRKQNDFA